MAETWTTGQNLTARNRAALAERIQARDLRAGDLILARRQGARERIWQRVVVVHGEGSDVVVTTSHQTYHISSRMVLSAQVA